LGLLRDGELLGLPLTHSGLGRNHRGLGVQYLLYFGFIEALDYAFGGGGLLLLFRGKLKLL